MAGGNKQRDCISKEDASSPTVSTESVLLTYIIDALENIDIAVINIPNAFVQTQIKDEKHMETTRLLGAIVDILCEIPPYGYKPYATINKNNNKTPIFQCLNALYETRIVSLFFYPKFSGILESIKFKINPYDPCVANKTVNGS